MTIIAVRASTEGIKLAKEALSHLGDVGMKASLRYDNPISIDMQSNC